MDKEKSASKTGFARLWQIAMMKKPLIIGSMLLSAAASVIGFTPYISVYFIIREILMGFSDVTPLDAAALARYGWIAFAGAACNIILYFAALMLSHIAAFGTLYRLKADFASHLARTPLGFHALTGSGKLRKIIDDNIEKVEGFIAHQLPDFTAALVAPVAMFVILFAADWRFGAAASVGVIVSIYKQARLYGDKSAKDMMNKYQSALEDMNNASVEYIRGISVVKAFKRTVYSFRRLREAIESYTDMVIDYTLSWEKGYSASLAIVHNVFLFIMPVAILLGTFTQDYASFAGTAIFYLIFSQAAAGILTKVIYASGALMQISGAVDAMDAILAQPELPLAENPKSPTSFDVEFHNVTFSYDDEKRTEALSDVSFIARQGEVTAVVGPSGGGKSAIASLIPRFFDVAGGSVSVGGVDIREIDPYDLMNKVSFVFQDVFLFRQSVLDNIRMGAPEAADERVIEAAKAAQCHEFIEKLPQGYQTVIGAKGVNLSGGERQRIAIARAIVKDCPIVTLDEATAFLDPQNERLIQKAFESLMRDKTVIMIAHRLSTARGADQIIVMDEGRVAERGTHDELMSRSGRYSEMWRAYAGASSWRMARRKEGTGNA
ncbi:MAG: ABC transporter ATP-binding protein/permease [Clostridiales bacterium]|jgi:ATP-binding cassette subfamily B protein|nr:ABC transporter ATP-binding protein/permease [Clostridiales bacterium]